MTAVVQVTYFNRIPFTLLVDHWFKYLFFFYQNYKITKLQNCVVINNNNEKTHNCTLFTSSNLWTLNKNNDKNQNISILSF